VAIGREFVAAGWSEGRNLTIEYRWAEGRSERFAEIAADFVRLKVDVTPPRRRGDRMMSPCGTEPTSVAL
jgi:hypothetical protein